MKLVTDVFDGEPDKDGFAAVFEGLLASNYEVWVMESDTAQGKVPVGFAVGRPFLHGTTLLGSMTWFPWASKRNVYESTVKLLSNLRKDRKMIMHVEFKDKKFAEMVARHGVIRRVGTLYGILDEPVTVFQSRMG